MLRQRGGYKVAQSHLVGVLGGKWLLVESAPFFATQKDLLGVSGGIWMLVESAPRFASGGVTQNNLVRGWGKWVLVEYAPCFFVSAPCFTSGGWLPE